MTARTVKRQHPAHRDDIGDLTTRRPLPGPAIAQLDPFLFLNHHGPQIYRPGNNGLPFGPHPHRGFETVTFILEGELAHLDSGGHESVIRTGGVQWMTAGAGIVHAELSPDSFKRQGGPLEILQLWVNLPSRLKMSPPAYTGLQRDAIPTVGGLDLIAGEHAGVNGPVASLTGIFMATAQVAGPLAVPVPRGRTVFLYAVRGDLAVAGQAVKAQHLIELNDDGDMVEVSGEGFIVLGHADPIGEPVAAHGPFVMNTREEIVQAIADYQAGRFGGTRLGA